MLVNDVRPDGPAARVGIQRGDILVGLQQLQTLSLENVNWILNEPALAISYPLEFLLIRNGQLHKGSLLPGE
jgi:S1-C subfamily serine protease